jgi:hypothetical protein
MAKVKFGALMTDARGKLGGHVFSKNRGGAYLRTKVTPSNPQTEDQQANRSLLGYLAQEWSNLTDAQRATWNGAVGDWKTTNVFGDSINPSGKSLFTSLNKNSLNVGGTLMNDAPAKVQMAIVGLTGVVVDISSTSITPAINAVGASFDVVVSATPSLSQGTSFIKNKLRSIYKANGAAIVPADIYTAYVARYGAPVAGQNIHFEVKIVASNGQMSVPENTKAVVQA